MTEWNEEDHPRDPDGRFRYGEGGGRSSLAVWSGHRKIRGSKLPGKSYLNVRRELIDHVIEHDGREGLAAVIHRKDGVKVYAYTAEHKQAQADKKHARVTSMAKHLPSIRRTLDRDLRSEDETTRALATIVKLVDDHYLRVGGNAAEERTGSAGASTLRSEHVKDGGARLKFLGKSGVQWDIEIDDPRVAKSIGAFARGKRRGEYVFPVRADQVNDYLREIAPKAGITIKDFRTFHATRLVSDHLSKLPVPKTKRAIEDNIKKAIAATAEVLGHTPTVCKSTYVNPAIIAQYIEEHARKG